ncbi:TetR/AcrR family transcriptional regulator [Sphingopyxis sp. R3-92]|uniref:TetR/AcrR family transcriptional regulator n=1 Tax=Sphingopyxis sp. R3-92 TaxID=3158553 RepID=UPI003EE6BD38
MSFRSADSSGSEPGSGPQNVGDSDVRRRKNPKQPRAVVTAEALMQATEQIIIREGFKNATTNRIAEVAGVSVGSLYQYFPNKQAIVKALIEQTVAKAAARIRENLRNLMDEPLAPALRRIMAVLLDIYKEHEFILFSIWDEVPELKQYAKSMALEVHTHSTNLAFLEQHHTELAVSDLRTALLFVEQATIHNMRHFVVHNPTNITEEQMLDELTKMAVNYLTK